MPIELNIRLDSPRITSPRSLVIALVDGLLYAFICPFAVLYIMPRFFMAIPCFQASPGFGIQAVYYGGMALMWSGGLLALVCTLYMVIGFKGTPLVTMPTEKLLAKGPYAYVRNPMMLSLLLILLGEAFFFAHGLLFVWLICWARIGHLMVIDYEEPQLKRRFGEGWKTYCLKVPRWVPQISSGIIK